MAGFSGKFNDKPEGDRVLRCETPTPSDQSFNESLPISSTIGVAIKIPEEPEKMAADWKSAANSCDHQTDRSHLNTLVVAFLKRPMTNSNSPAPRVPERISLTYGMGIKSEEPKRNESWLPNREANKVTNDFA